MGSGIDLQGIDQMLASLRQKVKKGADRLESQALRAAGEPMAEAMRGRVNVSDSRYTHMRDDIKVSRVIRRDGVKSVLIGPGRKTGWRAHFLEYGTSKMTAKPFAEPAFYETKNEAIQILADELRKGLQG
ncbi:HK97-gp10 family putative phage morphogenesis protein [Paenibacillus apiarius]|uniref:HK97-gp10 family putative phage morphogenesis protein n=1 Tax=Paenibacillus apiarius TaxID=46240 RepID=UPI003B3B83B1